MVDGQATSVEPGTLGELIFAYVAAQCDVLASNDVALRTGALVVHKTRVAVRRLRSTLRIFGDVFEAGPAEELDGELRWYADLLGQVRDRDVLSNRLSKKIADLPQEHVRGPAAAEIKKTLAAEREKAAQRLHEGMDSERYQHLVLLLRGWRTAPPLSEAGAEQDDAVVGYAEKAKGKADKRLRKAKDDIEQLHRARKATKRARYAAELAQPADGQMKDLARDAEELQTLLGEHQDAIVAANFLAGISSSNGATARSGFTYGVLMANELNRAAEIRASLKTS
jgi:CHAD domain-containing protein